MMIKDHIAPEKSLVRQLSPRYKQRLSEHWYQQWLFACHESEIAETGDYIAMNIGLFPVVLVRNEQGEINALNNSCRHRGSRVCQQHKGNVPNLTCPYHQWSYDLNGELTYARNMMTEIDITRLPLKSFACQVINGAVYVHLGRSKQDTHDADFSVLLHRDYRTAYQAVMTVNQADEAVLARLGLATNVSANSGDCAANARFYALNNALLCAKILPIDDAHTHVVLSYWVGVLATENIDYQVVDFTTAVATKLPYPLEDGCVAVVHGQPLARQLSSLMSTVTPSAAHSVALGLDATVDENMVFSPHRQWDADRQLLVCSMIIQETHNVRTYVFQTEDKRWFHYKPGQFITLELPVGEEKLLRTYTIVTSPSRPMSIAVTIKAQVNSIGTQWIFDHINVGDALKAYGPNGSFTFIDQPADKYLFISAGSGITPMMSMTRWLYDEGGTMNVNFISCIATPEDILYQNELERMAKRSHDMQVTWVCEKDDEPNSWTGYRGRFNKLILSLAAPDYQERDVYCCGPEPFMRAVREALDASGYDMNHYHEESFSGAEANALPDDFPSENKLVSVHFSQSNKTVESNQRDTLLSAAKSANIAIPSACGVGVCGTCKVKIQQGETHMVHSGGISQKDIDSGYTLACCTYPMSDVNIEM